VDDPRRWERMTLEDRVEAGPVERGGKAAEAKAALAEAMKLNQTLRGVVSLALR